MSTTVIDWTRVVVFVVLSLVVGTLVGVVFYVTHDKDISLAIGMGTLTSLGHFAMGLMSSPASSPTPTSVAINAPVHVDEINAAPAEEHTEPHHSIPVHAATPVPFDPFPSPPKVPS